MWKRFIISFCITMMLWMSLLQPVNAFDVDSESVILYDINNDCVIYSKNEDEVRQVASITKLLAILVAIEHIDDLNETIVVRWEDIPGYQEYSKVGLKQGDEVSYLDLLYGMMLPSGADAAQLITKYVAGSEEAFAQMMNEKAQEIGMTNSHFDNAIGRDSEQNYSTAEDLMKLVRYAINNPVFLTMFSTKTYTIQNIDLEIETTINYYTQSSDIDTSFILGAKTGFTDGAGYCLASLVKHENQPFILITLGGNPYNKSSAISDSSDIYTEFTENYHYSVIYKEGEKVTSIPIKSGWKDRYDVIMPETISRFINSENKFYEHFVGVTEINKNIKKGDCIGYVQIYQNEHIILNYPLYLEENIIYHNPVLYMILLITLIFMLFILRKKVLRKKRRKKRR